MSSNSPNRRRSKHVATIELAPSQFVKLLRELRRGDVLLRILLCLVAAVIMWAATGAWAPPFSYRVGDVPPRDITARVNFMKYDEDQTKLREEQVKRDLIPIYTNDQEALGHLRQLLRENLIEIISAENPKAVESELLQFWPGIEAIAAQEASAEKPAAAETTETPAAEPEPAADESAAAAPTEEDTAEEGSQEEVAAAEEPAEEAPPVAEPATPPLSIEAQRVQQVKQAFANDPGLEKFGQVIAVAFSNFDSSGVLGDTLGHDAEDGSLTEIIVVPIGQPTDQLGYKATVDSVRLERVKTVLADLIRSKLGQVVEDPAIRTIIAEGVVHWINNNIAPTLAFNEAATSLKRDQEVAKIDPVSIEKLAGSRIADRGIPLSEGKLAMPAEGVPGGDLRLEHMAYVQSLGWTGVMRYTYSTMGMYIAMYTLCGFYIYFRRPDLLSDLRQFATLLGAVTVTVVLAKISSIYVTRGEMVPLLLLGLTAAIAYKPELALLVSAATTLVVVLSLGLGLVEFVIILSSVATAILFLGDIRSRTKLIYVGAMASVVALLTTLGVGTFSGQPTVSLMKMALLFGLYSLSAGILMTGLLPFIERLFQVQTDISLLELGDAAHPLLQELVRRAPGTYNHSINVASIAEAAAESIGAKGLLVRVGAYFHDIGKMFKPEYFVENQGLERNRHDTLLPAMSTLVIIAHVKDGADLARQHHLPQSIIDFIQQHHGTTLVEYFYRQASKQSESDPDAGAVDETSFRYPGPKPQTKEAGVLMLADAVESASRALVDPTPARIESLVHELALKRLLDGQFDACGLTLQDLRTMETSLIKSLTAVYHGRVKYPDQERAS